MRLLRRGFVVGSEDEDRLLQPNGGNVTIRQTFQTKGPKHFQELVPRYCNLTRGRVDLLFHGDQLSQENPDNRR
jgi:hypothetical protein